jgi:hypothetical protein
MVCLPLPQVIGGPMVLFAWIVGALIVASTLFALLAPSGPQVTLSDIARQMETTHRSQPIKSLDPSCAPNKRKAKVSRSG